jgi:hexulose-6-phosphate isomerase
MRHAAEIGVHCVLVPCFEEDFLPGTMFEDELVAVLRSLGKVAHKYEIHLGLEMNWRAVNQVALVRQVADPAMGIYYDLGNSTAQGYDVAEDIQIMGPLLVGVHIKDRLVGGGSVLLGEGNTKFKAAFGALQRVGFRGPFVFETPRGNNPVVTARSHLEYVKTLLQEVEG